MKFLGSLVALLSLMFSLCVDGDQITKCSKHLGSSVHRPRPPVKGNAPVVCVSNKTCCSRQLEESLQRRVELEMKLEISKKYEGVKGSVIVVYEELKGYFLKMIHQSFRKTVLWLSSSHKNLTLSTEPLLKVLFNDMGSFVVDSKVNLSHSINQFFQGSFPFLYPMLDPSEKTLSNSYKICLMKSVGSIRPFGDKPEELVKSLTETLSPVQHFLGGLLVGANVITTAKEFSFTSGCDVSLLKMKYCSLCQGINDVKPCHAYCMDLMTKCMATEMQLRDEWSTYIKSLVSLAGALSKSDLPEFTSEMYKYLLHAASSVLTSKETLLPKVFKECGKPSYRENPSLDQGPMNPEPSLSTHTVAILSMKMEEVKPKIDFFTDVFLDLPKGICEDDQLAASPSEIEMCWNGDAKARFTSLKNPGAFQPSPRDTRRLKDLVTTMKTAITLVKTSTLILQGAEDKDGSASGGENEISGSSGEPCNEDDEDCGSTSGSTSGSNNVEDMYFTIAPSQPTNKGGGQPTNKNDPHEGQTTTKNPKENAHVLGQNGSPSFRCMAWQSFISASLVMVLLLK